MASPTTRRLSWIMLQAGLALGAALGAGGCEDPAIRFNQTGMEAYGAGDFAKARAAFEEAIVRNPEAGEYYFNRGMTEQALGNIDRAISDYEVAVHLAPRLTAAYQNQAACYSEKGDPDKALAVLEAGTKSNPYTAEAFINVARFHLARKDLAAAKLWLAKAVAADPDSPLAHREYASILLKTGEKEKGIEHLRKSLELAPIQPEVSAAITELAPPGDQLPPPKPQTE